MCSVVESEPLPRKRGKKKQNKVEQSEKLEGSCMKCTEMAVILVRNGDPMCRTCFLDYITHKFRATIGKARVIYQGEKILLAVSGGSSSAAMLDLVVQGLSKETAKKLRFQPAVVHIDEGELLGRSSNDRQSVCEHIKTISLKAGFKFHLMKLSEIYPNFETNNRQIVDLFNNVGSITAKEDLLQHLYRRLLLKCAGDHGYDKVMVGDSGTMLSVRILSDVAQGRGAQLPLNIGFQDTRSDIPILRPMREFSKKEIEFYNNFQNVTSFSKPSFTTKASMHASINRLTQDFIFGLQAGFPSTVSTVLRTADKVTSEIQNYDSTCSLCGGPINIDDFDTTVGGDTNNCNASCGGGVCVDNDGNEASKLVYSGNGDKSGDDVVDDSNGCLYKIHQKDGVTKLVDGGNSGRDKCCINIDDDSNGQATKVCHSGVVPKLVDGGNDGSVCLNNDRSAFIDGCDGSGQKHHISGDGGISDSHSGDIEIGDSRSGDIENCDASKNSCCVSNDQTCCSQDKSPTQISPERILSTLCYGCKLTHKDFKANEITLPDFVFENAVKTTNRIAMRAEIKDYLIDDNSS